ncbi:MAG: hypothetical protein QXX60_01530 [Sulfolobales archaeon]
MSVSIRLPPKGYIARRFAELSAIFLRGARIVGDELVITNCLDLHESLSSVINDLEGRGNENVFQTGNDRRYVTNKMAVSLGLDAGVTVTVLDILKALAAVIKGKSTEGCVPRDLMDTKLAVLNLLKVNFYEYGKAYLAKPSNKYVTIDRLPIITQLLAVLGALIADIGRDEKTHYYLLPPEGISGDVQIERINEVIQIFNQTYRILRNYAGVPRTLTTLKLASSVVEAGYEDDLVVGEVIGIQESRNRASLVSIEPISTEGLVSLMNASGKQNSQELANKLGLLSDIGMELSNATKRQTKKVSNTANMIVKVASDLLIYSRTGSLDALYSTISLLWRLSDEVSRSASESMVDLRDRLRRMNIDKPTNWFSRLVYLLSSHVR